MSRHIRMSAAEAIAAGLLDPSVAGLVKATRKDAKADNTPVKSKKKRSASRPAVHPNMSAGQPGSGSVELDGEGNVCKAVLKFDVVPVPKERPRVVRSPDGVTQGYTPARTKYFSAEIQTVVRSVMRGHAPMSGPLRIDMSFVMAVPESWPKWKKEAALDGLIVPTGRPDMDNLEKALLDAFNEGLIKDDAYVIERQARKIYGPSPAILTHVTKPLKLDINTKREAVEALRSTLEDSAQKDGMIYE